MLGSVLKTNIQGVPVEGKIVELTRTFIKVDITAPYINWTNCLIKSGPGAYPHPKNSFLLTYEETGTRLLVAAYRKVKCLDDSIDRACVLHDRLLCEIELVSTLEDIEIRERVIYKLKDWFFDAIFSPAVTGLHVSYDEKEKIVNILEVYKKEGDKTYIKRSGL